MRGNKQIKIKKPHQIKFLNDSRGLKAISVGESRVTGTFFSKRQYGFRKKGTITQAVLDLATNLCDNISKNKLSSLVAADLTKAFDTVNHLILFKKLDYYGIRGICNHLVRSYLSNRQQKVNICSRNFNYELSQIWSTTRLCFRSSGFYNIYQCLAL